jgi:hypothetical protein
MSLPGKNAASFSYDQDQLVYLSDKQNSARGPSEMRNLAVSHRLCLPWPSAMLTLTQLPPLSEDHRKTEGGGFLSKPGNKTLG